MERITQIATTAVRQAQTASENMDLSSTNIPQRQSLGIAREKIVAMMAVLNKRWLSQGWRVMDPKDAEPMAIVWIESLDEAGIPYEHYHELYQRSIGLRALRYQQGLKCDDFSVDMMISCWPGLRQALREEQDKRALTVNAESQCPDCYGQGWKTVDHGGYSAAYKCDHS